jgi:exopolysaccharide biosynthesis protein
LSGILVITPTSLKIIRSEQSLPFQTSSALQTGPFLINQRTVTPTLERKKLAVRSWIATDGTNNWAIGIISSPVSLAQAAQILSDLSEKIFPEHGIQEALNLDGGSSTSLLVNLPGQKLQEGSHHIVRDIICVKSRQ